MANPFRTEIDRIIDDVEKKGAKCHVETRLRKRDLQGFVGGLIGFTEAFSPDGFPDDLELEGVGIDRDEPFYKDQGDGLAGLISNIQGDPIIDVWQEDLDRERAIQFARGAELCINKEIRIRKRSHRGSERR